MRYAHIAWKNYNPKLDTMYLMGKTTIFITLVYVYMCVFLYHVFRIILVPTVIGKHELKICLFISFLTRKQARRICITIYLPSYLAFNVNYTCFRHQGTRPEWILGQWNELVLLTFLSILYKHCKGPQCIHSLFICRKCILFDQFKKIDLQW